MQYQVPQFIEIEDKIFGPLTFKQFAYVTGSAGLCFIFYRFLPLYIGVFFIIPVGLFGLALAFYKVNERPFIHIVEAAVKYILGSKLYLWKKEEHQIEKQEIVEAQKKLIVPKLSESKLRDLTWSLDINENIYEKSQKRVQPEISEKLEKIASYKGLRDDLNETKPWQ